MKRYVKCSSAVLAMALARSRAEERIRSLADEICNHVIKCLLYKNSSDDYQHWIKEISNLLQRANDVTIKPNNKKFSEAAYDRLLFEPFGETKIDLDGYLFTFPRIHKAYPVVDITEDLVSTSFEIVQNLRKTLSSKLSNNSYKTNSDIQVDLHKLLDKHCLGV